MLYRYRCIVTVQRYYQILTFLARVGCGEILWRKGKRDAWQDFRLEGEAGTLNENHKQC